MKSGRLRPSGAAGGSARQPLNTRPAMPPGLAPLRHPVRCPATPPWSALHPRPAMPPDTVVHPGTVFRPLPAMPPGAVSRDFSISGRTAPDGVSRPRWNMSSSAAAGNSVRNASLYFDGSEPLLQEFYSLHQSIERHSLAIDVTFGRLKYYCICTAKI